MIDIHTHILPGIDDGARDINESILILQELISQGVDEVIATPHIISGSYNNNRKIIDNKFNELNAEIIADELPIKIHKGAEIYCEPNIVEKTKREKLSLAGSSYVLIESDMQMFPTSFEETLYQFQLADFIPILAHAERYMPFLYNFDMLIDIANRGILIQINSGSILGNYGGDIQGLAHEILEEGCVHFIASDSHNIFKRPILMKQVYQYIAREYNEDLAKLLLEENPRRVINNEPVGFIGYEHLKKNINQGSFWKRIKGFFID